MAQPRTCLPLRSPAAACPRIRAAAFEPSEWPLSWASWLSRLSRLWWQVCER